MAANPKDEKARLGELIAQICKAKVEIRAQIELIGILSMAATEIAFPAVQAGDIVGSAYDKARRDFRTGLRYMQWGDQ